MMIHQQVRDRERSWKVPYSHVQWKNKWSWKKRSAWFEEQMNHLLITTIHDKFLLVFWKLDWRKATIGLTCHHRVEIRIAQWREDGFQVAGPRPRFEQLAEAWQIFVVDDVPAKAIYEEDDELVVGRGWWRGCLWGCEAEQGEDHELLRRQRRQWRHHKRRSNAVSNSGRKRKSETRKWVETLESIEKFWSTLKRQLFTMYLEEIWRRYHEISVPANLRYANDKELKMMRIWDV